jgi:cold shock protein
LRTGTVKWFNARKGCGVIQPDDGGFNVYVKVSAVKWAGLAELKDGQKIGFETAADKRTGELLAENLTLLPNAPTAPKLSTMFAGRKSSWFGVGGR